MTILTAACGEIPDAADTITVGDQKTIAILRAAPSSVELETGFLTELRVAGWVEGRNLSVLGRQRDETYPEPEEAESAVRRWLEAGTDLFIAFSSTGARIVMEVAPGTPVLFVSNDPSAIDLIDNEDQPEGSATGVTFRVPADRTLDLIRRAVPRLTTVGILYQSGDPTSAVHRGSIEEAGVALDMEVVTAGWSELGDVADTIVELAGQGAQAIVLSNSPGIVAVLGEMEETTRTLGLPVVVNVSIAPWALIAVYPDPEELGRQLARQAARILSGSSPNAVPVEDPRSFGVRVNLVTADELGIEVPADVVREATEVISP